MGGSSRPDVPLVAPVPNAGRTGQLAAQPQPINLSRSPGRLATRQYAAGGELLPTSMEGDSRRRV